MLTRPRLGAMVLYEGEEFIVSHHNGIEEVDLRNEMKRIPYVNIRDLQSLAAKKMDIGGFKCTYEVGSTQIDIHHQNHSFTLTYFGDAKVFLKANETMIASFFSKKIDDEVQIIMEDFTKNFAKTILKLKKLVLPNTKDLLLTKVIEVFKANITEVAKLFSDTSIKNTLINLFK